MQKGRRTDVQRPFLRSPASRAFCLLSCRSSVPYCSVAHFAAALPAAARDCLWAAAMNGSEEVRDALRAVVADAAAEAEPASPAAVVEPVAPAEEPAVLAEELRGVDPAAADRNPAGSGWTVADSADSAAEAAARSAGYADRVAESWAGPAAVDWDARNLAGWTSVAAEHQGDSASAAAEHLAERAGSASAAGSWAGQAGLACSDQDCRDVRAAGRWDDRDRADSLAAGSRDSPAAGNSEAEVFQSVAAAAGAG